MDDYRELIELAAKAIGLEYQPKHSTADFLCLMDGTHWAPRHDDGDAFRLAVKLHLEIDHNHPLDNDAWVMALSNGRMVGPTETVEDESGRAAATRLAIVRAAAAIGEDMR